MQVQEERLGLKWAKELALQELLNRGSPGKASEGVWARGCRGMAKRTAPSPPEEPHGRLLSSCHPWQVPSSPTALETGTSTLEETPAQEV